MGALEIRLRLGRKNFLVRWNKEALKHDPRPRSVHDFLHYPNNGFRFLDVHVISVKIRCTRRYHLNISLIAASRFQWFGEPHKLISGCDKKSYSCYLISRKWWEAQVDNS